MTETLELARTITTEAGPLCSIWALWAVAHVYQRNPVMHDSRPATLRSFIAALTWRYVPDPSRGAIYLLSRNDVQASAFGRRIARTRGPPVTTFACKRNLALYAYR